MYELPYDVKEIVHSNKQHVLDYLSDDFDIEEIKTVTLRYETIFRNQDDGGNYFGLKEMIIRFLDGTIYGNLDILEEYVEEFDYSCEFKVYFPYGTDPRVELLITLEY